jgi:hypothetical protein
MSPAGDTVGKSANRESKQERVDGRGATSALVRFYTEWIGSKSSPGHTEVVLGQEGKREKILDMLESIHTGRFSAVSHLAVLFDISSRGFERIYHLALLKGKDNAEVSAAIQRYSEQKQRVVFAQGVRARRLEEQNQLTVYYTIIEKKLGAVRFSEVSRAFKLKRPTAKNLLALLRPAEAKIVEIEYDRRVKYLAAVINNKCPHVRIYRQFRQARTDQDTRKHLGELRKFFKGDRGSDPTHAPAHMIQCSNCGFDIMCPHLRDFTEMELASKSYGEIKARLTKYIDRAVVKDQYYCKICGEMISSLEAFGDIDSERDPTSTMNEELKNFMWGEIAMLAKHLKFSSLVDVPRLISAARDAMYPFIFEIEKQILKSKTNSADEIKAKKRLYVTIYAFAYFIHLVTGGRGDVSFKDFKGAASHNKNPLVDLMKHAIGLIMLSRNVIIREIPGMSADIIKNTLVEAYKSLQVSRAVVIARGDAEDLVSALVLDPVYRYFYTIELMAARIAPTKRFDMVDRMDHVLGAPIAKLEKSSDIFGSVRVPKFDGHWQVARFDDIAPIRSVIAGNGGGSGAGSNILATYLAALPGYVARSFEHFYAGIKAHLYTEPLYMAVNGHSKSDRITPPDVKFRPAFEAHHAAARELLSREAILMQYRSLISMQNYQFRSAEDTRRWHDPGAKLGRVFDTMGDRHQFTVYIDETGAEHKSATITKALETGTQFTAKIVDQKCTVCGVKRSEADGLDEEAIRESLYAKNHMANLLRFYENRCPAGELHEYDSAAKDSAAGAAKTAKDTSKDSGAKDVAHCKKCGRALVMDDAEAHRYYQKYKNQYIRDRGVDRAPPRSERAPPAPTPPPADLASWTFNFNVILDLSTKLKINHKLIHAIGAVEMVNYDAVQSGEYIPPEVEERNSTRGFVVNAYVKNLITEYNQLRFFHRLVKPPLDLSMLIDNSGINKHEIANLAQKLPDIYDDYNAKFRYFLANKKPREIVDFSIQRLCEMCLKIWGDPNKETERLRRDFVTYFIKKTIRGEELLSKPGHFNWSLLFGDKDEKEPADSNFSVDAEADGDDDESREDDGSGDTGAPLKAADFDIDRDPDADEMDADDDDQGVKVGEEYGMD